MRPLENCIFRLEFQGQPSEKPLRWLSFYLIPIHITLARRFSYDVCGRVAVTTDKLGATTTYAYNAAGNLIKKAAPDGTTEYTYTAQNKLKTGKTEDGQSSTYTYNALDARIKNVQVRDNKNAGHANSDLKDGSHGTDYLDFLMDGRFFWQRTWETEVGTTFQSNFETATKNYVVDYLSIANRDILVTEDGSFTQRYVYDENSTRISTEYGYAAGTKRGEGGENLQSDFAANDVRKVWYRTSHLGSTLFAVDENGKVISHTIYDPWGNPLTETYTDTNFSGIDNSNNYTGYTWDEVLDLYFAQNRFYDSADHQFTQEEPIKDGENWYGYCGNNPIVYFDFYGFSSIKIRDFVVNRGGTISWNKNGRRIKISLYGKSYEIAPNNSYYWNINDNYYTTDAYLYQLLGLTRPTTWGRVEIAGVLFSKDVYNGVWYAELNAKQRIGGYNDTYDQIFTVCDYTRFETYFTANDKSGISRAWRIEGWKGNYLNMGVGGEIGLYYRNANSKVVDAVNHIRPMLNANERYFVKVACDTIASHYFVVEDADMMEMQFNLYNGKAVAKNLLFIRKSQKHWWITGFRPGIGQIASEQLTMTGSITFPNSTMATMFRNNVQAKKTSTGKAANRFVKNASGATVTFTWGVI